MPQKEVSHNNNLDDEDDQDDGDECDDHSSLSTLTDRCNLSTSRTIGGDSTTRTVATSSSSATVAEQDACWDGCWLADGLHGMFLHLTTQKNVFIADDEFVRLDMDQEDQDGWGRLHVEVLEPRNLQIAAGVIRRISEGTCPKKLPIRTLSENNMKRLQDGQHAGDRALVKKNYKKVIAKYNKALQDVITHDFFVAPSEQMEDVADMLCSTAQAYLSLGKYAKAGKAATASLLFVGNHETARLCRAKAAMAMQSTPYLIQAQVDLQEVLHNGEPSEEEEHEADQLLQTMGPLLRTKCTEFESENPNANWQVWVESIKAKCW
mmetsp:Transcript_2762/g.5462  ORF Transcript_2762/g.5462 Transcript_2762/m.5462 type:complete len:321 (+) Transcript_2762:141-1103(+)